MNMATLLAWCLANIECDMCPKTGATFDPERDKFLCESDRKMVDRLRMLARQEQQELPDLDEDGDNPSTV